MALMPDEQYVMISDSIEKKNIARSSRCRKTHCGKGGRVKFPSDYKTKKELKAMNGDVKTYNLNKPMSWTEFKALPEDLKITYIKKLRNEFNAPDKNIAEMMGVTRSCFCKAIKELGLSRGSAVAHESIKWDGTEDQKRFYSWCGFYQKSEEEIVDESVVEEEAKETDISKEFSDAYGTPVVDGLDDGVRVNNTDIYNAASNSGSKERVVPTGGRMSFDCKFEDAMNVLDSILNGNRVRLNVEWVIVNDGLYNF